MKKSITKKFEKAKVWLHHHGYSRIALVRVAAGTAQPEHGHHTTMGWIVLQGKVDITHRGKTKTHGKGDRFELKLNDRHASKIGKKGCVMAVGKK